MVRVAINSSEKSEIFGAFLTTGLIDKMQETVILYG